MTRREGFTDDPEGVEEDMTIELTPAERNMLIVLLIEQESKFPDQPYIQMVRRLKERLHRLGNANFSPVKT